MGPSINYERTKGEGGGSRLPYISIAYYMQKGGEGVQIACKIAYVLNGRPIMGMYGYGYTNGRTVLLRNWFNTKKKKMFQG